MKITKNIAKIMTIVTIILGILFSLSILTNSVYADGIGISAVDIGDTQTSLSNIGGMFLSVVQIIGTAVAVVMLIVLAIKYISASPNDKAQIKQHAVVYIVGAIILFAAAGLIQIIKSFADQI